MRDRCRSPSDLFVPFLRNAMKVYIYFEDDSYVQIR